MKKYAVYPRNVKSLCDGEIKYIGFHKLCKLYNVDPDECVDMSKPSEFLGMDISSLQKLYPSVIGNYDLGSEL